jgi:hypothetical protein
LTQDPPNVTRVVGDPGHPFDHLGHPVQSPELVAEAAGARPFEQGHLDGPDLLCVQPRSPPSSASALQRGLPFLLPAAVPNAGGLDAHLELGGDFSRPGTIGEERGRLETAPGECFEVSSRPKPDRGQ